MREIDEESAVRNELISIFNGVVAFVVWSTYIRFLKTDVKLLAIFANDLKTSLICALDYENNVVHYYVRV